MELKLRNNKPFSKKINISKKEKNLLLLLGIVIIFWILYKFIYTPQQKTIYELEEKKFNYEDELARYNIVLSKEEDLKSQWKDLNIEYEELSQKYYSSIEQPEIIHMLNEIIDNGKLIVPSINFSTPGLTKIGELETGLMTISLPYEGSYTDLNMFLTRLRAAPKRLLISQISLSKDTGEILKGEIALDAFAYGNVGGIGDGYFYNNQYVSEHKENPFKPFKGYVENEGAYCFYGYDGLEEDKRYIVNDLEADDIYFMSTNAQVTGNVSRVNKPKYDGSSIRTEYFISTDYKPERVYLTLDDKDIILKYPPQSIGIWSYAYGYSPVTVGLRFSDMDGRKIDLELTRGINWTGWEYISASPPQDINVYPLKLDRIYMELGPNRDDYGVLLFDRMEASYPLKEDKKEELPNYVFYVVKPGDTLLSISESFYGSKTQYKKIMKDNGLVENSALEVGRILVIQKIKGRGN